MIRNGVVTLLTASAVMSCLIAGCGGGSDRESLVSASGKVFVDDKPHGPAQLLFSPVTHGEKETRPTLGAAVNDDGTFTVTTYETGDGAPPGDYTVTMSAAQSEPGSADPAEMMKMMGGGGGVSTLPLTVTIPEDGSSNLELKFVSGGETPKDATGGPNAPLGAPGR